MEHRDSIELWIYTSKNINKTIEKAADRYDTKTIISWNSDADIRPGYEVQ